MSRSVPCRLFGVMARKAPVCVLFRRGPSKRVQLIRWDTKRDHIESGQWFHGRIYERRCDLSPDGSLLVYFAQKISNRQDHDYWESWTAVSRPPWLTALALWPKGDCWIGGGLFQDNRTLLLNHRAENCTPHPKHLPGDHLDVELIPNATGEDLPLFFGRLTRDGWFHVKSAEYTGRTNYHWGEMIAPDIWHYPGPSGRWHLELRSWAKIDRKRQGLGVYYEEYALVRSGARHEVMELPNVPWADWDHRGRLAFAREGKLFVAKVEADGTLLETELADFNSSIPEPIVSPPAARKW